MPDQLEILVGEVLSADPWRAALAGDYARWRPEEMSDGLRLLLDGPGLGEASGDDAEALSYLNDVAERQGGPLLVRLPAGSSRAT